MDDETKKLLDIMGFNEEPKKNGLYSTIIHNGIAFIDFRTEDGRRYANVGGKNIQSKDADTIPILKTFKERREEIKNKILKDLGASQNDAIEKSKKESEAFDKGKFDDLIKSQSPKGDQGQEKQTIPPPSNTVFISANSSPVPVPGETILEKKDATTPIPKEGVKTVPPATSTPAQQPKPPAASQSSNLYEFFLELVGKGGIIEIFGDTGTLKSQLCTETCKAAKKLNKTFFYLDTEGKVGLFNKKFLNGAYQYLPVWNDIIEKIQKGLPKNDLLIVDSIGFPISAKSAGMRLDEMGQAWNDMMSLVGDYLKAWAFNNNALVLITNQPKSDFMKSDEELKRLGAVGDKVHFAPNLILKSNKTIIPGHFDTTKQKAIPPMSIGTFTSFRSTDFMDDVEILSVTKNNDEIIIEIPKLVRERLQKLKE